MDHHPETPPSSGPMMRLAGVEDDQYDALADLFLGESELAPQHAPAPEPPRAYEPTPEHPPKARIEPVAAPATFAPATAPDPAPRRDAEAGALPMIELLVLGHLPVRAALWVRQYACSVARRCNERVALVRLASGSVTVDLINATEHRAGPARESGPPRSLHEALALASELADRIVLRVDETSEPEILGRDEIDTLTILTGADEAAVVSSYRFIKSTTMGWDEHDTMGAPHLRLAVMGASAEQAAQASVKLTRAIDAFLERPIEIIDAAGRIDSTATESLYQGSADMDGARLLDTLVEANLGLTEDTPDTAPTAADHADPVRTPDDQHDAPHAPEIVVAEPHPTQALAPSRQTLSALLPALSRLVTKCPHAPDVELACDDAGRLHLVVADESDNASLQLESARTWVRDHLDLIIRAEPRVSLPIASRDQDATTAHLLATDPPRWRSLIDSDTRLYALATARAGTRTVRIATPLN